MSITVRRATFADVEKMLPLTEDLHRYLELGRLAPYDPAYIELFLATATYDEDKLALVADNGGGEIIGMLIAHTMGHWWNPAKQFAQELMYWVRPQHRSLGAGAELLHGFEAWAKEHNLDTVGMSRSGIYQREKLEKIFTRLGYVEESVIYLKRV